MADPYRDLFSLQGKVVLVAGGTGAIGLEMARACVGFGAQVAVSGRGAEKCAETQATLIAEGLDALGLPMDITDAASIPRTRRSPKLTLAPLPYGRRCATLAGNQLRSVWRKSHARDASDHRRCPRP